MHGQTQITFPRLRWGYNITMDLKEVKVQAVGWIRLVQNKEDWRAVLNTSVNLRVSQNVGNTLAN